MARSSLSYLRMLQSLLPKGRAWSRAEGSALTEFLYGQAEEFARVDQRSDDLLQERDTRYAIELLTDHEIDLGLPDECSPETPTVIERQRAAHTKLIAIGRQDKSYFIDLAAALGWTVTITEFTPCWCGLGECGDPCGDQWVIFCWQVTVDLGSAVIIWALSGTAECGDYISYIPSTDEMICIFNRYKPAHTMLLWAYDGPEYDYAFSSDFDSMFAVTETASYLAGAFDHAFSSAFDVCYGGDYSADEFSIDFKKPA